MSRWEQAQGTAVPSGLGLDLSRERVLCRGRRGQVPGGGAQAQRIPGRDVFHWLVCLSLCLPSCLIQESSQVRVLATLAARHYEWQ